MRIGRLFPAILLLEGFGYTLALMRCSTALAQSASFPSANIHCQSPCIVPSERILREGWREVLAALPHPGAGQSFCGDELCHAFSGEICENCTTDCGPCQPLLKTISQCIDPNHMAITFDDGPTNQTYSLLDQAQELNIPITLFINGYRIVEEELESRHDLRDAVIEAYQRGHTIGSHTYSHRGLASGQLPDGSNSAIGYLPIDAFVQEMMWNDYIISEILGVRPLFLRPPFLSLNDTISRLLEDTNYYTVMVNVDSRDWALLGDTQYGVPSEDAIQRLMAQFSMAFQNAKSNRTGGFITLQHEKFINSIQALPAFVELVQRENVKIVSLPECLGIKENYRNINGTPITVTVARAAGAGPKLANGTQSGTRPNPNTVILSMASSIGYRTRIIFGIVVIAWTSKFL